MSAVEVGCRVLRGPDWNWGRQDGGDGHVGTVVEVGGANSVSTPDKTVVVLWDTGNKTNYRVGYQNAYDLRVYDTAPTGVKHLGTVCVGCREQGIRGIRWRCSVCPEHDLCTPCYMSDKHDINHPFFRFERPGWPSREMPRRRDSDRLQVRGIFVGAKVVRGADWEWGDQDGNKPGRVTEVHGWESESSRSVAAVTWVTGISNVYRLGHQGKVDLMYAPHGDVAGGLQYVDHLPVLGKPPDPPATSSSSPVESSTGTTVVSLSPVGGATIAAAAAALTAAGGRVSRVFAVGDRVKVSRDVTVLQGLQEGHGGWNPRMTEYVGRPGVVHRITDRGDIRVQYTNNVRWTVNPAALVKINPISVGDPVKVIDDAVKVKLLQRGHGEWIETMRACLGKAGQITKIYSDGDLRVNIDGQTWTLNRQCVTSVTGNSAADVNTMRQRGERDEQPGPLASFISGILDQRQECSLVERMVREAAQGRVDKLRELVDKHPDKIDGRSNGRVALQLCCHQGHIDCVRLLLHHQADISAVDEDGDTPLHYAAFGNQAAVMELLISSGCCVDALNKSHCTALHVSVNKQHAACVRVLVNADSDPNIQDSYGDTALHDAIGKENMEIIDLLASVATIDFKLKNKRGFNTLHHAALKGNVFAVERILSGTRQVVDIRKDDGFTALHLSCLNGHGAVVERLVEQGQCNVDVLNNRRQTPLLLAAAQLHVGIVEYLVGRGASINLADDDGDTCLHLVSAKSASSTTTASSCDLRAAESPLVHGIQSHLKAQGTDVNGVQALACYLAQEGAALDAVNRKLRTPLDLTPGGGDGNFNQLLRWYSKQRSVSESLQLPSLADLRRSSPSPPGDQQNGDSGDRVTGNGDCTAAINGLAQRTASKLKLDNGEESCMICCDLAVSVEFEPCGHRVTCSVCCARMKKCIRCQSAITAKRSTDGSTVVRPRAASSERLRLLETKIAEIEEVHGCSICLERRRNVVFLCGHGACAVCAHSLQNCHMCRKPITQKINIY